VIKLSAADSEAAGETKKTTKTATTSATEASKAEAENVSSEAPNAASPPTSKKTGKAAAPATEGKVAVVLDEESAKKATSVSETLSAKPVSPPAAVLSAQPVQDEDTETVSFTLALSSVSTDQEPSKNEPKVEAKTTTGEKTKTRTTAAAAASAAEESTEKKKQLQESPRNSPDAVLKRTESEPPAETKKKAATKKTTKTAAKGLKSEAINGEEKLDSVPDKMEKPAAPAMDEKKVVVTSTEPLKTPEALDEVAANAVNGEAAKSATKIVKKKTKKISSDTSKDAAVDEMLASKKEIVAQNQTVTKTEPPKAANIMDEAVSVVNGEVKSTAKTTKKKTVKKMETEKETLQVTEQKEISLVEVKPAAKEKVEDDLPTNKSKANETKTGAAETTTVKKKSKKVTNDVSVKGVATQEDATVLVEKRTADEPSGKQTDEIVAAKILPETETAKPSYLEATTTAVETTSVSAKKEATVSESPISLDKMAVKKKKPKKAVTAMPAPESEETKLNSEMEFSVTSSVDVTPSTAVAEADSSEKAPPEVTDITEDANVAPDDPSKEGSVVAVTDVKNSASPSVVPVIATTADEAEMPNVVTVVQLDMEDSMQKTTVEVSSSSVEAGATTKRNA